MQVMRFQDDTKAIEKGTVSTPVTTWAVTEEGRAGVKNENIPVGKKILSLFTSAPCDWIRSTT